MDEEIIETTEDGEAEGPTDLVKKLRAKLKESEEKAQEYLTGWQKERADSVNARKRLEEEKKEFAKFANENLIMEILPSLDSFDMAMANKEVWGSLPKEWTKGIEYIYTQLLSALEAQGIKRIYPLGEKFDPSRDEAIVMLPVEKEEDDHKILEVTQPGYLFNSRIVRTAKVKVGEYKSN
ncbi:MAG TPA: nucleotide exchange factor GrpE [Candidatus Paceibacterota bacterium]